MTGRRAATIFFAVCFLSLATVSARAQDVADDAVTSLLHNHQ